MRLAAAANPREYTNPGVPKPWAITGALEPMQIAAHAASVAIRSHGTQRAGILGSSWIGLPEEIGKNSNLRFLQSFTEGWKDGADGYLNELNK